MTTTTRFPRSDRPAARGMTLLEVLISCGVLVVGLASIASLLPAAGSRLAQATTEDRGGTLAANARTDAEACGLVAIDLFMNPAKSIAFGKGLQIAVPEPFDDFNQNGVYDNNEPFIDFSGDKTWSSGVGNSQNFFSSVRRAPFLARIDPPRGFVLEDEVVFTPPTTTETPLNSFLDGRRVWKEGICWGGTLVPQSFPAKAGSPAVLVIAVFRKEGQAESIPLTTMSGGLYRMTTLDEVRLKRFLKSCSFVLVPGTDPAKGPRWFRITASWRPAANPVTKLRSNDGCYIAFADSEFADFAGANPTVIGFDNLIRVDQYNVILQ